MSQKNVDRFIEVTRAFNRIASAVEAPDPEDSETGLIAWTQRSSSAPNRPSSKERTLDMTAQSGGSRTSPRTMGREATSTTRIFAIWAIGYSDSGHCGS